jgi:hypothetical protein
MLVRFTRLKWNITIRRPASALFFVHASLSVRLGRDEEKLSQAH